MILDTYAYDDSTLLNLCKIELPQAFRWIFNKSTLESQNCSHIEEGLRRLRQNNYEPHRFVPDNLEQASIDVATQHLQGYNVRMLPTLKAAIVEQLASFMQCLERDYKCIQKGTTITAIRSFFQRNERPLRRRPPHIPEDDDCSIIAGYVLHPSTGRRVLVSFDEHFWGYSDPILTEFGITVVPEWDAHRVPL